ncbi:hypothetical protein GSI_04160 [Ganoderma sinense ZZ0214-1]|uniref:Uncharacterized protein n=1 Tax=Ganoderma sinense ZZ0214-1 TaxID=1077348 RepID=A0A2G8SIJ1_9APHY|nr:hypothetical protein GSI_04160 [Ganoderma sinense ZZ0214-1]
MASEYEFPAPVGGVPYPIDFWPSILFTILYALMLPVVIFRMLPPRSRNGVLISTTVFSLERVATFCMRAYAAHSASARANTNLETYLQMSYGGGFSWVGTDLTYLLRALLVSSTLGGDMLALHKLTPPRLWQAQKRSVGDRDRVSDSNPEFRLVAGGQDTNGGRCEVRKVDAEASADALSEEGLPDQPLLRRRIRRWSNVVTLLSVCGMALSIVAGTIWQNAIGGSYVDLVRALWYVSTGLAVALLVAMGLVALIALFKMPRVPRASLHCVILITVLLSIVGVYRITVIGHSTTSLLSTVPGAQNSMGAKAGFYALHVAPEFLSAAILMGLNVRRVFGTGPWGDHLGRDPKPKREPTSTRGPGPEGEYETQHEEEEEEWEGRCDGKMQP